MRLRRLLPTDALLPLALGFLVLPLLAGCDAGTESVDRATVTVREPGEAILGDAATTDATPTDTPAEAP